MKVDPEDFRRHYDSLSDDALLEIDRNELVPVAQGIYDEEVARRHLAPNHPVDSPPDDQPQTARFHAGEEWLENGACAYSSIIHREGDDATQRMLQARDILEASGIPADLRYRKEEPKEYEARDRADVCEVVVPANLILYASSVLDRQIFNDEYEESYRTYFSSLSDEEFRSVDRQLLFAGLLDRLERVRKAYEEEMARRRPA